MDFFKNLFPNKNGRITPVAEFEKCCRYCEYSIEKATDKGSVFLCKRRQRRVPPSAFCSSFSYDLLKRKPRRQINIPKIDPDALN